MFSNNELIEWINLLHLAKENGVSKEEIKNFIEGRKEDESKSR